MPVLRHALDDCVPPLLPRLAAVPLARSVWRLLLTVRHYRIAFALHQHLPLVDAEQTLCSCMLALCVLASLDRSLGAQLAQHPQQSLIHVRADNATALLTALLRHPTLDGPSSTLDDSPDSLESATTSLLTLSSAFTQLLFELPVAGDTTTPSVDSKAGTLRQPAVADSSNDIDVHGKLVLLLVRLKSQLGSAIVSLDKTTRITLSSALSYYAKYPVHPPVSALSMPAASVPDPTKLVVGRSEIARFWWHKSNFPPVQSLPVLSTYLLDYLANDVGDKPAADSWRAFINHRDVWQLNDLQVSDQGHFTPERLADMLPCSDMYSITLGDMILWRLYGWLYLALDIEGKIYALRKAPNTFPNHILAIISVLQASMNAARNRFTYTKDIHTRLSSLAMRLSNVSYPPFPARFFDVTAFLTTLHADMSRILERPHVNASSVSDWVALLERVKSTVSGEWSQHLSVHISSSQIADACKCIAKDTAAAEGLRLVTETFAHLLSNTSFVDRFLINPHAIQLLSDNGGALVKSPVNGSTTTNGASAATAAGEGGHHQHHRSSSPDHDSMPQHSYTFRHLPVSLYPLPDTSDDDISKHLPLLAQVMSLNHPHVARVFGVSRYGGKWSVVSEFGHRVSPPDSRHALPILRSISLAMLALSDCGLALREHETCLDNFVLVDGRVKVAAGKMCLASGPVDVTAVGALLFYILTGSEYDAGTLNELDFVHAADEVKHAIRRCVCPSAADDRPTIDQLLAALDGKELVTRQPDIQAMVTQAIKLSNPSSLDAPDIQPSPESRHTPSSLHSSTASTQLTVTPSATDAVELRHTQSLSRAPSPHRSNGVARSSTITGRPVSQSSAQSFATAQPDPLATITRAPPTPPFRSMSAEDLTTLAAAAAAAAAAGSPANASIARSDSWDSTVGRNQFNHAAAQALQQQEWLRQHQQQQQRQSLVAMQRPPRPVSVQAQQQMYQHQRHAVSSPNRLSISSVASVDPGRRSSIQSGWQQATPQSTVYAPPRSVTPPAVRQSVASVDPRHMKGIKLPTVSETGFDPKQAISWTQTGLYMPGKPATPQPQQQPQQQMLRSQTPSNSSLSQYNPRRQTIDSINVLFARPTSANASPISPVSPHDFAPSVASKQSNTDRNSIRSLSSLASNTSYYFGNQSTVGQSSAVADPPSPSARQAASVASSSGVPAHADGYGTLVNNKRESFARALSFYRNGHGDLTAAYPLFSQVHEMYPEALLYMAESHYYGSKTSNFRQDPPKSFALYLQASQRGILVANVGLADCLYFGFDPARPGMTETAKAKTLYLSVVQAAAAPSSQTVPPPSPTTATPSPSTLSAGSASAASRMHSPVTQTHADVPHLTSRMLGRAHAGYADCLFDQHDFPGALEHYRLAVRFDGGDGPGGLGCRRAWARLAQLYIHNGTDGSPASVSVTPACKQDLDLAREYLKKARGCRREVLVKCEWFKARNEPDKAAEYREEYLWRYPFDF
ncbi:Receptor-interacting serine/threonine-protein kinase 3 [Sorochytrium milnesiophthora]